jgi:hypothetical protein
MWFDFLLAPLHLFINCQSKKPVLVCRFQIAPFDYLVQQQPSRTLSLHLNEEPPMKFAFLGYHVEQGWQDMSKRDQDAMIAECFTYDKKLLDDGHMLGDGTALQPARTAKVLRFRNGKVDVTDGPFSETKEVLGGVGLLEAADMEQAVELMTKHPGLRYGSTFELRPVNEETLKRKQTALAKLGSSVTPVDPQAKKFAVMGHINEQGGFATSKEEFEALLQQCTGFDEERIKNGQWLSGIGLQTSPSAKTLRGKGGKVVVTDGPYAETKEVLGGVVVLALKDMNEAVNLLSKHPALRFGVAMEIRPIHVEIDERWNEMAKK